MLSAAIESEVADYIEARKGIVDEAGCRLVVRNGSLPERQVTTGLGPVSVRQPRVRDKRSRDQREVFTPGVLPKYLRKTKSIEDMIPWLYLKGISTNDFPEALQSVNPLSGGWPCSAVCWSAGFSLWDYRVTQPEGWTPTANCCASWDGSIAPNLRAIHQWHIDCFTVVPCSEFDRDVQQVDRSPTTQSQSELRTSRT